MRGAERTEQPARPARNPRRRRTAPSPTPAPDHALLASIVESTEGAIFSSTLDSILVGWNRGSEKLLGYSHQQITGSPVAILALPSRVAAVAEFHNTITRGDSIAPYDAVLRAKDDSLIDVSLAVFPVRGPSGKVASVCFVARDIRERKLRDAALAASEERHRATFEQAAVGIIRTAPDGRLLRGNARFALNAYQRKKPVRIRVDARFYVFPSPTPVSASRQTRSKSSLTSSVRLRPRPRATLEVRDSASPSLEHWLA
jgi:PAS domain S-box-containing protein